MSVQQLADKLDVDEKTIRRWLREGFPAAAPGQGRQWELTSYMVKFCEKRAAKEVV
jgi:predicted site-specific integrase-resolvase